MEFPRECLTRAGNPAILYSDRGDDERIFVGAYHSGTGWIPCSWYGNGRYLDTKFTGLDLLLHDDYSQSA